MVCLSERSSLKEPTRRFTLLLSSPISLPDSILTSLTARLGNHQSEVRRSLRPIVPLPVSKLSIGAFTGDSGRLFRQGPSIEARAGYRLLVLQLQGISSPVLANTSEFPRSVPLLLRKTSMPTMAFPSSTSLLLFVVVVLLCV
jgi:hypothetical protein